MRVIHTIEYCMYIQWMIVLCRRLLQSILINAVYIYDGKDTWTDESGVEWKKIVK